MRGAHDCRVHFAIDKNASVACLCAEPSGKIDHRPDRGVVAAPLKAYWAERRISVRYSDAKPKRMAGGAPSDGKLLEPCSHRRGHSRSAQTWLLTGNRIIEQHSTPSPTKRSSVPSNSWIRAPSAE